VKRWIVIAGMGALLVAASDGREQIERGTALYGEQCASCHGARMEGQDVAPALRSPAFASEWHGRPVADLTWRINSTMPQNAPGTLDAAQTNAIAAAILHANDQHGDGAELPESPAAQKTLLIGQ